MSIIDITEEIASDVDVNVELDTQGLRVSVFIDECEIHDFVDYQTMAYIMVGDRDKYPDEVLDKIRRELAQVVDILEEATRDEHDDDE